MRCSFGSAAERENAPNRPRRPNQREPMTTAISATRRQVRELVDGTLEVRIHIDPTFKRAFYDLFPDIDTPVAIAPLKPDFAQPKEDRKDELKGGPLSVLAGRWCNDPKFWEWHNALYFSNHEGYERIDDSDMAREFVLEMCEITSRKDLDHNPAAARIFHEEIRLPYSNWLDKQRRPE